MILCHSWKDLSLKSALKPEPLDQQASAIPTELPGLLALRAKYFLEKKALKDYVV